MCHGVLDSDAEFDFARRIIEYWGHGWEQRTEALLLALSGAHTIGLDITAPAANAADHLIRHVGGLGGGVQGDARFLPIASGSVDVVYSSGVLHHSPDIARSVTEIYRVLQPGGTAHVMLYATWSLLFFQERLAGLLRGHLSTKAQEEHMSANTEGAWRSATRTNPLTRTFTAAECEVLFAQFATVSVRKSTASVRQIRIFGRLLAAMNLVTWLDRRLDFMDRSWGACLYIQARK
jgi:SAM-dependent methyltransferase